MVEKAAVLRKKAAAQGFFQLDEFKEQMQVEESTAAAASQFVSGMRQATDRALLPGGVEVRVTQH